MPVLGATVAKLRALAERVDELVVLDRLGRRGRAARQRARAHVQRPPARRSGHALRERPGAGARPPPAARRGARPHVPDLRRARRAARPADRRPGPALVHPLAQEQPARDRDRVSSAVLSVDERTFPVRRARCVAIGHGIDVADLPCVKRPDRGAVHVARARPHLAGEGARDDPAGGRGGAGGQAPASSGRRSPPRSACTAWPWSASSSTSGCWTGSRSAGPSRAERVPTLLRGRRRAREQHAGGRRRQGRVRGGRDVPARARLEPARSTRCSPRGCGSCTATPTASPRRSAGPRGGQRRRSGRTLRGTVEREHSVDTWADRVVELAG